MSQICFNSSTAQPQLFSFPPDVIKYAIKNCNASSWLKLIKTCKYFYGKHKICVFDNIMLDISGLSIAVGRNIYKQNVADLPFELFLIGKLILARPLSILKPRIYKCYLRHLCISKMDVEFEEFKFLTSSKLFNFFEIHNANIFNSDKSIVQLEDIFAVLPYVTTFIHKHADLVLPMKSINLQTLNLMAKSSRNEKLLSLELCITSNNGSAEDFVKFIKKHAGKNCKIILICDFATSVHFNLVTDQMLQKWNPQSEKPTIEYLDSLRLMLRHHLEQTQSMLQQLQQQRRNRQQQLQLQQQQQP